MGLIIKLCCDVKFEGLKFLSCSVDQVLHAVYACRTTVNGERFTGLNFRVFHSFQEYRESFSVNISASLYTNLWPRQCKNISAKTLMVLKL